MDETLTQSTTCAGPRRRRINLGGNYCGHQPDKPRLDVQRQPRIGPGGIPRILTDCTQRLRRYYYEPRRLIPALDLANRSHRQQRSERREACVQLLSACLGLVDLASLRVGIPTHGGFVNHPVHLLANHAGLPLKRAYRALADLKAAGLITVAQKRDHNRDGSWTYYKAVKAISRELFLLLGFAENKLKKARDRASARLRERFADSLSQAQRPTPQLRALMGAAVSRAAQRTRQEPSAGLDPPAFEENRQLAVLAVGIKQKHPDWTRDKCYQKAAELLSRAPLA